MHAARRSRWPFFVVGAIVVAAGALRLLAARDEFWVDEIVSWRSARSPQASVLGILFGIHSDNNHHLNTIWMYLIGDRWNWMWYRLPAVLFGTGVVALSARLAQRTSPAACLFAAILTGGSLILVQYSSEARGYAGGMFFSLLALLLLRRHLERSTLRSTIGFPACCVLGLLSHLTFLYIYAGLLAWSAAELLRRDRRAVAIRLVRLHAAPLAVFVLMFSTDFSRMVPAGGPEEPLRRVVAETLAWTLGMPTRWAIAAALIAIGIFAASLAQVARQRGTEWIFYLVAILVGPALMLLATHHPYVYPRYFVLPVPLFFLLASELLGTGWRRGGITRAVSVALVAAFLIGNSIALREFFRDGRGHYLEALRYIAAHSHGPTTVGSTRDGRNEPVVAFYQRYLAQPDAVRYVHRAAWATELPAWMIVDSSDEQSLKLDVLPPGAYQRVAAYPHAGLSGVNWYVLRKEQP